MSKNREKACQSLQHEIKKSGLNPSQKECLKKEMLRISEMFLTEKAQKTYQWGESLYANSPRTAIEKFRQSLSLEPLNTRVLTALARAHYRNNDCEKSLEMADKGLGVNPYVLGLELIRAQSYLCLRQFTQFRDLLKKRPEILNLAKVDCAKLDDSSKDKFCMSLETEMKEEK